MADEIRLREYAKELVREFIEKQEGPPEVPYFLEVVWFEETYPCQWRAAVGTSRPDDKYYQVTFHEEIVAERDHYGSIEAQAQVQG